MLDLTRQSDLVDVRKLANLSVTIIGAGSVGSFVAMALTKLGLEKVDIYDIDGVADHNIPNQFYRIKDANNKTFKVAALSEIIEEFNGVRVNANTENYSAQKMKELVVVCTDSITSRKVVYEQFSKQPQSVYLIDARMGGELAIVYTICKVRDMDDLAYLKIEDDKFYKQTLHSEKESEEISCTARTIIYNVMVIAGLVSRQVKGIVSGENPPREIVFDMKNLILMPRA